MKPSPRRASASVAIILCAVVAFSATRPAEAVAGATPAAPTGTRRTTPIPGSSATTALTTTTSTTVLATPTSTTTPPTTVRAPQTIGPPSTVVSPTTNTTVGPVQLAALMHGLEADVAQAQAVGDYLAARAVASSLGPAQMSARQRLPATADPLLVEAATTQLRAAAAQTAAQQRFEQARHRIGQVAIALYLGEQVPRAGAAILASLGNRSAFLAGILETEQRQAKLASQELVGATAAARASRQHADRLVQSRTLELQAIALRAAAVARAGAGSSSAGAGMLGPMPGAVPQSLIIQESPTIIGPSVLSAEELAGWLGASGHRPNLTVTVTALAATFVSAGAGAGVRADIAFAQSVLETGYFSFPGFGQVAVADNNFAGIGACDSCATGLHFPDALTGVEAQMQLLHAYATTSQPAPGPLPGPFSVSGCCPTWMQLTGVWATASDYGIKILRLYRSMVHWALARRTAAAHL